MLNDPQHHQVRFDFDHPEHGPVEGVATIPKHVQSPKHSDVSLHSMGLKGDVHVSKEDLSDSDHAMAVKHALKSHTAPKKMSKSEGDDRKVENTKAKMDKQDYKGDKETKEFTFDKQEGRDDVTVGTHLTMSKSEMFKSEIAQSMVEGIDLNAEEFTLEETRRLVLAKSYDSMAKAKVDEGLSNKAKRINRNARASDSSEKGVGQPRFSRKDLKSTDVLTHDTDIQPQFPGQGRGSHNDSYSPYADKADKVRAKDSQRKNLEELRNMKKPSLPKSESMMKAKVDEGESADTKRQYRKDRNHYTSTINKPFKAQVASEKAKVDKEIKGDKDGAKAINVTKKRIGQTHSDGDEYHASHLAGPKLGPAYGKDVVKDMSEDTGQSKKDVIEDHKTESRGRIADSYKARKAKPNRLPKSESMMKAKVDSGLSDKDKKTSRSARKSPSQGIGHLGSVPNRMEEHHEHLSEEYGDDSYDHEATKESVKGDSQEFIRRSKQKRPSLPKSEIASARNNLKKFDLFGKNPNRAKMEAGSVQNNPGSQSISEKINFGGRSGGESQQQPAAPKQPSAPSGNAMPAQKKGGFFGN